jgi:hypothetical protein
LNDPIFVVLSTSLFADKTVKRYVKFGEFVADLRRVFSNAIKYNGAHLTSDTTGITRAVYDAAKMLQERLEGLLGPFTMNLAERIDRAKLTNAENQQRQAEVRAKLEKEEAEAKKFEQLVSLAISTTLCLLDFAESSCLSEAFSRVPSKYCNHVYPFIDPCLMRLCCCAGAGGAEGHGPRVRGRS